MVVKNFGFVNFRAKSRKLEYQLPTHDIAKMSFANKSPVTIYHYSFIEMGVLSGTFWDLRPFMGESRP